MFIYCTSKQQPIFCRLKPFDGTRLYYIRLWSVLRYTAFYGFIRQSGNYWTIPAQVKKRNDRIFSILSGFCADMGKYPFLSSDCLKRRNTAFSGILCRCAVCPIVPESRFPVQYRQGIPMKYYVNLPTCPLSYYVNRSDPQENSCLRSICLARSGSGRISADGRIRLSGSLIMHICAHMTHVSLIVAYAHTYVVYM